MNTKFSMQKLLSILILLMCNVLYAQKSKIILPTGHSKGGKVFALDKKKEFFYSSDGNKVIMWNYKSGGQMHSFSINSDISALALNHAGDKLIIAAEREWRLFSTVTGEELWHNDDLTYYVWVSFSEDDKYIFGHRNIGAINQTLTATNIETLTTTGLDKIIAGGVYKVFDYEGDKKIVYNPGSWRIVNFTNNEVIEESKLDTDEKIETILPLRKELLTYIKKGSQSTYTLRSMVTGKKQVIKIKQGDYDYFSLDVSQDDDKFIMSELNESDNEIVSVYSSIPAKKIPAKLSAANFESTSLGYFSGATNIVFANKSLSIVPVNITTNIPKYTSKRLISNFGIALFNSISYAAQEGVLNISADDSAFKTIDLKRMVPLRHAILNTNIEAVAFSSTGDTVAIFNTSKAIVKNIKTGKIIQTISPIPGEVNDRNIYFNKNGTKIYFPVFSVPTQKTTFFEFEIATKKMLPVFSESSVEILSFEVMKEWVAYRQNINQQGRDKVKIIHCPSKTTILEMPFPQREGIYKAQVSMDGKVLLFTGLYEQESYEIPSGKLLVKRPDEESGKYSYTVIRPNLDASKVLTGDDNGFISIYDDKGKTLFHEDIAEAGVREIFPSPDNNYAYVILQNGTIEILNQETGKILGTLYVFNNNNDFVFMSPDGRFDGTKNGMEQLKLLRNRQEISLDKVYERFYTPNLYQRLINGEAFEPIPSDIIKPSPLVKLSYAEVARNLSVEDDMPTYQNKTGFADITVNATAEDDAVDEIRLFINGKIQTLTTRNLIVAENNGSDTKKYQVSLLPGLNMIRAIALNTQRTESDPDEIAVMYNTGNANNNEIKPANNNIDAATVAVVDKNATLYLIAVGINAYQNKSMSLNYALADATAFKEEVEKDAKTVISNIKTYFVTDNTADKAGITNALKEVQQNAKPQDLFIFYYAGHGVIGKNNEFYLVPTDVSDLKNVQTELENKGIAAKLLQQYAIDIPAQKQLFILDACQSAGAFETMLASDGNQQKSIAVVARSTGTHWIAASGAQQFANEFASLGHGAFTYVLLQALKGEAANNKMITVNGLKNFLQIQVPALMKKYNGTAQYPASYGFGNDFPVEIITK